MTTETYIVKAGDTLSRIARLFRTSLAALVQLNRIRDPNRIFPDQRLQVPGAATPDLAEAPRLGSLSRKYEVGSLGPGAVSSGHGDRGGVSYGSYQLASKLGRPAEFLAAEGKRWSGRFAGLEPGTVAFSTVWRACAAEDPTGFEAAQHRYIERTHFAVQAARIRNEAQLDVTSRSRALQDVVWSAAVQHGPNCDVVLAALGSVALSPRDHDFDRVLIEAIYAERGRRLPDGRLVHFRSNSRTVQESVARRLREECKDALKLLDSEYDGNAV